MSSHRRRSDLSPRRRHSWLQQTPAFLHLCCPACTVPSPGCVNPGLILHIIGQRCRFIQHLLVHLPLEHHAIINWHDLCVLGAAFIADFMQATVRSASPFFEYMPASATRYSGSLASSGIASPPGDAVGVEPLRRSRLAVERQQLHSRCLLRTVDADDSFVLADALSESLMRR